jgi:hypothetical protein
MATLTISLTGTALMPNASKSYTVSDADIQRTLNYVQATFMNPRMGAPINPTPQQVLLTWVQQWINTTMAQEQQYGTAPATPPPPIQFQ